MHILFLCTGNSCRSILAEAVFNHLAPQGWHAVSAGSHPTGQVHPRTLKLLEREGISTVGLHSKSWDAIDMQPDLVITVCDSAANETCPAYLTEAPRAHWGVKDPAKAQGDGWEVDAAFVVAYRTLRNRIEALINRVDTVYEVGSWTTLMQQIAHIDAQDALWEGQPG